jgi:hypothetical protein
VGKNDGAHPALIAAPGASLRERKLVEQARAIEAQAQAG